MALIDISAEARTVVQDAALSPDLAQRPFRPIQYLGNKLRAFPAILDVASSLIGRTGQIADLFTGTTIVAQAFARSGYKVSSVDTQKYAVLFARAMLGVGRRSGEFCSFDVLSRAGVTVPCERWEISWEPWVAREREALDVDDPRGLLALTADLPLIWREAGDPSRIHISSGENRPAFGELPLLAAIYAGTYFGVLQALTLDRYRQNAELALSDGRISVWQYCATLTAIMSAASAAAHSAGKHFAQPMNAGAQLNQAFLSRRLLQDRRVSVEKEFQKACDAINGHAAPSGGSHTAWHGPAESFVANAEPADLYYLDPPYTAQQYSRFYHVLETLSTYQYPQLLDNGALTTGLYPKERYKSAFSSKRKSPAAFQSIVKDARTHNAALVISYSESAAQSVGNARMISLRQLLALCSAQYGAANVEWHQLSHRYRQFNSAFASNAYRDDSEILITCKPR